MADQEPGLQTDALEAAGCHRVFVDHASGATQDRPELRHALDYLRAGDTLVVWRLDRLGRSISDLIEIVAHLERDGMMMKSLTESIDTSTPGGKLIFHVFASLAEFERELIRERTIAGLRSARARGRKGGRPTVMTEKKLKLAEQMLNETDDRGHRSHTVADVAGVLGVSRASIYRALERRKSDAAGGERAS